MWTSWICSSTLLGIDCLRLALWNQSHYPTAADPSGIMCRQSNKCHWSVAACTCLHTPLCRRAPTCRSRMRSCPAVVSVLPVGRAVGGVAILAVLLAIWGPVLVWLPTVCHACCLLGHRGGDRSPVGESQVEKREEKDDGHAGEVHKSATRWSTVQHYSSTGSAFVSASTGWDMRETLNI